MICICVCACTCTTCTCSSQESFANCKVPEEKVADGETTEGVRSATRTLSLNLRHTITIPPRAGTRRCQKPVPRPGPHRVPAATHSLAFFRRRSTGRSRSITRCCRTRCRRNRQPQSQAYAANCQHDRGCGASKRERGLKPEQRKERPMDKGAPENAGASAGIPDGRPTASVPRSNVIQRGSNQSAESFIPSPDGLDDLPGQRRECKLTRI